MEPWQKAPFLWARLVLDEEVKSKKMFIMDTHCDSLLCFAARKRCLNERSEDGQIDLPRLREGGVNAQVFAAFIESKFKPYRAVERAFELLAWMHWQLAQARDEMVLATTAEEIRAANGQKKIAALLSVEGGEAIGGDLENLARIEALGVSSLTLTWNHTNLLGAGCWEEDKNKGLTSFGRDVVREMNRLKMIVDLAHAAEKTFYDVLECSEAPVFVSHANCRKICEHRRNLTDSQIKALAQTGGTVGITFEPSFVDEKRPNLDALADHIDHLVEVGGIEVVGIGSDFDGSDSFLLGLEDAGKLPVLVEVLKKRGYSERELQKIMGENHLALWERVRG